MKHQRVILKQQKGKVVTIVSGDITMNIGRFLLLFTLLLLFPQLAHAQFPTPPSQAECRALVERVATEAAGQSSAATRQRIERYILDLGTPQPQLQNNAGVALLIQGYPHEAIWCMAKAVGTGFDKPEVLNNIGLALTLLKKYSQAERVLLYTTHTWPEFSGAWVNLARMYLDRRDNRRAEEAIERSRQAEPGNLPAEEAAGRMAIQIRDRRAAARQAVNISSLDPGNPWVAPLTELAGDSNIERELSGRVRSIPMPRYFIDLDHPINSNYEALVMEEINEPYWNPAFKRFANQAVNFNRQNVQFTPEMISQMPPEVQAAFRQLYGDRVSDPGGVSVNTPVLAPSGSRADYLLLAKRLEIYSIRYRGHLKRLLYGDRLEQFFKNEFDRQLQFYRDYAEEINRGVDIRAAMNHYVRRSIGSLEGKHGQWLDMVEEARRQQNNHLRRFWMSTASLLSMVPDAHRNLEIHYLRQQAAMTNEYYLAQVVRWVELGKRPLLMDMMLNETAPDALHAAAANRELEAQIAREEAQREWEEELEADVEIFDHDDWIGLNLGAFSIKVQSDEVGITIGEALQGDLSYNWADHEFEMGLGPGVATPPIGILTVGGSAKMQGVIRVGGESGAALGVRRQVQVNIGTPVAGTDINLIDQYTTLISAGAPLD
jgi:hypothetical protein